MEITLYQPDIPQNTGTILRMAACLNVPVNIIEPCGFVLDDKRMRRSGMDYLKDVDLSRYANWESYKQDCPGRQVLLSTKASVPYTNFQFQPGDTLILGRESAGVPGEIHNAVEARVLIPMVKEARSLNIAVSAAMVLGEAMRQVGSFPD
ncbi:MAG: tRNA (cytidine(34)-2'-O)-methyltransferase [Rhodospirillales bacterium]|nr:tRNA (cytidine(34)-2'-O)-methyltransferase [Rhodospirillales bacterium]